MYLVGKVIKPRGLKGELKVRIITSFPGHFEKLDSLFVKQKDIWQAYSVIQAKLSNGFVYLKFKNINSVEQAEQLRNAELGIEQQQLEKLEQDEYYVHDLIGLKVFDEQGLLVGTLTEVETYPGNDVYVVQTEDGREYLIPGIKKVNKHVDMKNNSLTIHVMEGLLD